MSNIYILEPPTKGKVLLKTTLGDLDIELWSKEAPLAARNFVQLCMEGYYDGTIFHRVVKGFIAQGGDPTGTGEGGQSIYGEPFKDEFHQRLRFTRRGLLAMANAGKNDNGSQFFFTLGATPELNNKHTIFGKITGDTIYNMLKFEEADIGPDDRPEYPHTITSVEILSNPFPDIVPRSKVAEVKPVKKEKKKEKGVKNFKLLSFGDEAEEDEEEVAIVNKNFVAKNKTAPDLVDAEDAVEEIAVPAVKKPKMADVSTFIKSAKEKKEQQEADSEVTDSKGDGEIAKTRKGEDANSKEVIRSYMEEQEKYKKMKSKVPSKGESRESQTLEMLMKFRNRIQKLKTGEADEQKDDWMVHELKCEGKEVKLAKDANTKADDWFDITDPRNELNKRKRLEKKK
uniref:Spliceosome-associated protein CWC27 homolog n=1 Tax=Lygus hesperus TaxID=30085 RepID=A0A146KJD8_LYGHE